MNRDKIQGLGLSLRFPHFNEILKFNHSVPWFEVMTDDFLSQGPHWKKLSRLRQEKPIALHSIGLNVGGVDAWNVEYLKKFKELYQIFEPEWISDHLCWSSHNNKYHHDLLPIPRTHEGLKNVVSRIQYLQDYFARPLVLENITQYIDFKDTDYSEVDFIKEVVKQTDCGLLLDVTNLIINHKNRKLDYNDFLKDYPLEKVKQYHIAGGVDFDGIIIDSHSEQVRAEDLQLVRQIQLQGHQIPGVIERDSKLPSFIQLDIERAQAVGMINEL